MPHLVALFGYPLGHSVSPAIHHAAASAVGIELEYRLWPVRPEQLAEGVAALRAADWFGANVTLPHKPAIPALVDGISALARRIGAVNTLYKQDGALIGENTDAPALVRSLREQLDFQAAEERVLILGAGGAARAALVALVDAGVRRIDLWNRTPDRVTALLGSVDAGAAEITAAVLDPTGYPEMDRATLLINATSVGLDGLSAPIPQLDLPRGARVYDLVYGCDGTPLVRRARAAGFAASDGLRMLAYQAAGSFALWTGRPAPKAVMLAAAERALAERAHAAAAPRAEPRR